MALVWISILSSEFILLTLYNVYTTTLIKLLLAIIVKVCSFFLITVVYIVLLRNCHALGEKFKFDVTGD